MIQMNIKILTCLMFLSFPFLLLADEVVPTTTPLDCRCKDWGCDENGLFSCADRNPAETFCAGIDNPEIGTCCKKGETCVNGACVTSTVSPTTTPLPTTTVPITTTPLPTTTVPPITTTPRCECYRMNLVNCSTGKLWRTICCDNETYDCEGIKGCLPASIWETVSVPNVIYDNSCEDGLNIKDEYEATSE